MYYVYLLQSAKTKQFYIGITHDLRRRFAEHNAGKSFATQPYRPWRLIYYEAYDARRDAETREAMLKYHGQGLRRLKERLVHSIR